MVRVHMGVGVEAEWSTSGDGVAVWRCGGVEVWCCDMSDQWPGGVDLRCHRPRRSSRRRQRALVLRHGALTRVRSVRGWQWQCGAVVQWCSGVLEVSGNRHGASESTSINGGRMALWRSPVRVAAKVGLGGRKCRRTYQRRPYEAKGERAALVSDH